MIIDVGERCFPPKFGAVATGGPWSTFWCVSQCLLQTSTHNYGQTLLRRQNVLPRPTCRSVSSFSTHELDQRLISNLGRLPLAFTSFHPSHLFRASLRLYQWSPQIGLLTTQSRVRLKKLIVAYQGKTIFIVCSAGVLIIIFTRGWHWVHVMSQMNPIGVGQPYFFTIHFNNLSSACEPTH